MTNRQQYYYVTEGPGFMLNWDVMSSMHPTTPATAGPCCQKQPAPLISRPCIILGWVHVLTTMQVQEMEAVVRQSQAYAQTLQNYNTSLQADVQVGSGG